MTHDLRAETITISGHGGDEIEAYLGLPTDVDTCGSIVVIHHMPGYDEATKEIVRKFAANGYAALMPNLYHREAPGAAPDDAAATARASGGVPDERLVGDVAGAMAHLRSLATSNSKVASIGYCSGGRQSLLAGCRLPLDAVIDCYGAFTVVDSPAESPLRATAIVAEVGNLRGPVLGLFGADDQYPSPEQNQVLADALTAAGKDYHFRTFDGAAHAFFNVDRPSFRPEAALEGWREVFSFLERTVA
ncbi:MAG: dienelactone hydrolase family protein [Acidobacteriota bacterium]|nr:dienelactone hydrolase family protein [Acidobacteriota bacterium]MDE3093191.1 dienelactone hydrolase family protein [Acidobacteriota bacterium]MDE3147322.1 dienelactone hydrolase family protein [Acidobacteriota bacterium]